MTKIIFERKRAVSETIGTLLLLTITVVGAVMISNFVSDGFFRGVNQNPSGVGAGSDSLQLTGLDTRDSNTLINVASLDNNHNSLLCTKGNEPGCTITLPNIDNIPNDPINPGTEFIALQLRNMSTDSIFLRNIQINNVLHEWDEGAVGTQFDASSSADAGTKYPRAGYFSIIPSLERPNPDKQFSSQEVQGNEEVRVIVKLSQELSDIKMGKTIKIAVNFGGSQPAEFIVTSGDAKW